MKEKRELCHKTSIGIIIIVLFGLFSTQATAASFDCKKAASWLEKNVCSNPELSKLDEQMAKAYSDALKSLSPEGQKETKQYQKQWLKEIQHKKAEEELDLKKWLKELPHIKAKAEHKGYKDNLNKIIATDLELVYQIRITQLKRILIKFPDRIFRHVYVSRHSETDKSCPRLFEDQKLTYLQIENPRDENEKSWNNLISKEAFDHFGASDKCQDNNDEYTVTFSNKHLISVKHTHNWWDTSTDEDRGEQTQGYFETKCISWLLEDKRELKASDLFNDKTDWQNKIVALVAQKVTRSSELTNIITSPSLWEISKNGLHYLFSDYGAPVITIDWKTLDPYLSKNGRSLIYD